MIKGLDHLNHLPCEKRLRHMGLFNLKKSLGGMLSMPINTLRKWAQTHLEDVLSTSENTAAWGKYWHRLTQRGCGVSHLGGIQKLCGHGQHGSR